jgi:hypothetical protein
MKYKAHIKNGVAVLDGDVKLQEGTEVLVQPITAPATLGDLLRDVTGKGQGLPQDGSTQHDHYISMERHGDEAILLGLLTIGRNLNASLTLPP